MTLNDLKEELSALGFERDIELDSSLVISVRRALATVYTERGVYGRASIEHYPIMPTLVCKSFTHKAGSRETFTLNGRAFSFTVSGSGSFFTEKDGVIEEHSFSSPLYLWRGFICGETKLTFYGDFSFQVFSIAVFDSVRSAREEDLFVYGEPFEYRLRESCENFHSFASLPTDERGEEIEGVILLGDKMIIPWGYRGRINLTYKAAPPKVSRDTPDEDIPVPAETEHLIALLSAAYYWADDAPDKAEYYLSLYKDALDAVKKFDTRRLGGGYRNVTGWA